VEGRFSVLTDEKREEDKMRMEEVRKRAKTLGLKNTFGLSKVELIRRIQRAEGNFDCFGTAIDYCDQSQCCFREDCLKPSALKTKSLTRKEGL
jgi:hypothetical protein